MSIITFQYSGCKRSFEVPASMVGTQARCTACGTVATVPTALAAGPSVARLSESCVSGAAERLGESFYDAPDASAFGSRLGTTTRPKRKRTVRQRISVAKPEAGAKTIPQEQRTGAKLRWLALAALTLFGGLLLSRGLSPPDSPEPNLQGVSTSASPRQPKYETREIRDIRTGHRVMADNPEMAGQQIEDVDVNPETWRNVVLRMTKDDGGLLDIVLLRSLDWIAVRGADAGGTIYLDLEEFGAVGPAQVLSIDPCPPIEEGPGRIVTATFAHSSADILNVYVDGLSDPVGATTNHPFWSEDRQAFVAASQLQVGEQLRLAGGEQAAVRSITRRAVSERVYNLEVNGQHVYFVGTRGVLVHNLCQDALGRWHRANGQFAKKLGRPAISTHGNSRNSRRVAYLYALFDENGDFLKYGITQDRTLVSRYGRKFLDNHDFQILGQGRRSKMLDLERSLVESGGGPWNFESWSSFVH